MHTGKGVCVSKAEVAGLAKICLVPPSLVMYCRVTLGPSECVGGCWGARGLIGKGGVLWDIVDRSHPIPR